MNLSKAGHGPHLLHEFYRDIQLSRQEALSLDNSARDQDHRHDRVDLGQQQTLVHPHGLALREAGPDGEPALLVWLEARQEEGKMIVDQQGFARDKQGYYAFPIHLEGGPQLPFDPPDAERISAQQFEAAVQRYEEQWLMAF